MQEQKKFKYIYNGKEVDRKQFEELTSDSFKWFEGNSIVSVPFSSFDSFFNGDYRSNRQINNHIKSVLDLPTINCKFTMCGQKNCICCYPTKSTNSTRHKSKEGETHIFKTATEQREKIKIEDKDDVITSSNRGEKETIEHFANVKEDIAYDYTIGNQETQVVEWINKVTREKEKIRIYKNVWYSNYPMHEPPFVLVELDKNADKKETMDGLKYNNLKPSLDIVINRQFTKALQLIALATEYGHKKYIENDSNYLNYKSVKGGSQTYFDASARHSTNRNGLDESGLPHIIHAVWSSLAGLELWSEENNINVKDFTENYMKNLHNSK